MGFAPGRLFNFQEGELSGRISTGGRIGLLADDSRTTTTLISEEPVSPNSYHVVDIRSKA